SIIGVPLALRLATWGGWQLPFFVVAGMGLLVAAGAIFYLPPVRGHLAPERQPVKPVGVLELLGRRDVQLSYLMTAVVMMASFLMVPNISAYVQQNLGYPRDSLELAYFVGGLVSFVSLRMAGPLVDRYGAFRVGTVGSVLTLLSLYVGFVNYPRWLPVPGLFMLFMLAMGVRNVAYNTLTSRVPENPVRARFMSLQSAIQHMAAAVGAFVSVQLLTDLPDGTLGGMTRVAGLAMVLTALLPPMLGVVEAKVRSKERARALAVAPAKGLAVPLSPEASPHQ
ncbi:MFS transporter, partial [Pyxidicoccus fallax]